MACRAAVLVLRWSGRTGWTRLHVLAVAAAALLLSAAIAFGREG